MKYLGWSEASARWGLNPHFTNSGKTGGVVMTRLCEMFFKGLISPTILDLWENQGANADNDNWASNDHNIRTWGWEFCHYGVSCALGAWLSLGGGGLLFHLGIL